MIQDFSTAFDGKQSVKVKSVSYQDRSLFRRVAGMVLTIAMVIGIVSCLIFGLLIKSGLKELDTKKTVKAQLIKEQQKLYAQRSMLLEKDTIEVAAAGLGLYSPYKKQVRRL